jgi:serine/threonine-protein kinase HipA
MGALRLRGTGGWLSSDSSVARLDDMENIVAVARRYEADEATDEDVEYLGEIATSPGGARPKANMLLPSGMLALAKLPHSKDGDYDTEAWEAVALTLARNAGIQTSAFTSHRVSAGKSVLVVQRFDRTETGDRLGYISAATALGIGANDDSRATYQDFADTIAELSKKPFADLREMFARVALTVLTNNVDDHWRNHGFLRDTSGWRLAPAFDINPSPRRGIINSRAISREDDPRSRDIRNLIITADAYRLTTSEAAAIVHRVGAEVEKWGDVAESLRIPAAQIKRMQSAFDTEQLDHARQAAPVATQPKETGDVWIRPHTRNGKPVDGYWKTRPTA